MNGSSTPPLPRQWIRFAAYKLDPAFHRLGSEERIAAREEFAQLAPVAPEEGQRLTYSCVGLRGDCDFMFWTIAWDASTLQKQQAAINHTRLGAYLTVAHSFLSMTKRSIYIDKLDPHHTESRTCIVPGKGKYIFVYPFVKTRKWYLLPMDKRQEYMDDHIRVGNKYPSVKLNTTYSFGLDDQDFVVAFETDVAQDFLDLVMELRSTEASEFTVRDTPILTAVRMEMKDILAQLM